MYTNKFLEIIVVAQCMTKNIIGSKKYKAVFYRVLNWQYISSGVIFAPYKNSFPGQ